MTNEENIRLVTAYRAALEAGDAREARKLSAQIVQANLGLVRRLSMRFARPESEEDKEDAMQAGAMGVLRAVVDFDPARGSFSTHAGNHIRDYVQRWTGKTVAVVRPRSATMPASIARAAAKYRMTYGREPAASDLGITDQQLAEWSSSTHFVDASRDADASDEEGRASVQLTYDEKEAEHEAQYMQFEKAWQSAIEDLSPRNRDIATRVLLKGEESKAVGESHGLTHSRVLQVCKRIEVRLRRALNPEGYDPAEDPARVQAARQRLRRASQRLGVSPKVEVA